jgi:hypothetical protein
MKSKLLIKKSVIMKILILIFILQPFNTLFGQTTKNDNLVFWSSTRKLTTDDFVIKTKNGETNPSFAQFSVDYQVSGFDFMTKNFNKKVRNYFIKSASWIDTTSNVSTSLRYEQTLFDMCEIYTRQFRKALKENRKKIASGTQFVDELNQKVMTDFSNRRVVYDGESNFGQIAEKQAEWELQIQSELNELKEFANE